MSVFNGERYLKGSIESVLCQDFSDYEFIIVNDGSTDNTATILDEYQKRDPRIRVMHQENRGLIFSLNRLVDEARGAYLARQDADDVSARSRLRRQYNFLQANRSISVLGTSNFLINGKGKIENLFLRPAHNDTIVKHLGVLNPMCHGSVMAQKKDLEGVGFYDDSAIYAEDYDLWCRTAKSGRRLANLREPLYFWRAHEEGTGRSKREQQRASFERIRCRYFTTVEYSNTQAEYHCPGNPLSDKLFEFKGIVNAFECQFRGHGIRVLK